MMIIVYKLVLFFLALFSGLQIHILFYFQNIYSNHSIESQNCEVLTPPTMLNNSNEFDVLPHLIMIVSLILNNIFHQIWFKIYNLFFQYLNMSDSS